MHTIRRSLSIAASVWVGALAMLAVLASHTPASHVLSISEMQDSVRGATPVDCTKSIYQADCNDIIITQPGATGPCRELPQQNCLNQPCRRCQLPGPWSRCNDGKPWTVRTCKDRLDLKRCGKLMINTHCNFVGGACICTGGMMTEYACAASQAVGNPDCEIVP
jgi:hypothetical protein